VTCDWHPLIEGLPLSRPSHREGLVNKMPPSDRQLRIERRPPTLFRAALNASIKRAQVQVPNQSPDRARWMVFVDQRSTSTAARSSGVGPPSASTAACRSHFLGSCREVTADSLFCKTEVQRVSSQLQPKGAALSRRDGQELKVEERSVVSFGLRDSRKLKEKRDSSLRSE
jgi:hypothetical protein